ncbi:hypothetical protein BC941DRAFT_455153 [Chlamydoabsidia padenii]|nr:hypothetical protein BC941DRAFT_455153 [Chlamydoabsidia padenii]
MPAAAMDQEPSFGCECGQHTSTRSVRSLAISRFTRHDGDNQVVTLLKRYHLIPATPTTPRTAFHVELFSLFGDARSVLSASLDGFSKIRDRCFYNGRYCRLTLTLVLSYFKQEKMVHIDAALVKRHNRAISLRIKPCIFLCGGDRMLAKVQEYRRQHEESMQHLEIL